MFNQMHVAKWRPKKFELIQQKIHHVHLLKVREGGGVVSARVTIASARGILLHCDRLSLGGHIQLNRLWAYSLLSRVKFVKKKAKSKDEFSPLSTVEMEEIPSWTGTRQG